MFELLIINFVLYTFCCTALTIVWAFNDIQTKKDI